MLSESNPLFVVGRAEARGAGDTPGLDSGLLTFRGVGTETRGRIGLAFSNGFESSGASFSYN